MVIDNLWHYVHTIAVISILEYFKLNEEPFRISPNPRFLYLNEQTKEANSKIKYMTKHRTAPLYMYGKIGSGKTSILRQLYEDLKDDKSYTLRLLITPNVRSSMAFLRAIMDAFEVPTDRAYDRSLKQFEDYLITQYKQNKVPTLFIDEAQNMTRDILKLIHYLLNFETSGVKLLQIVLTGQEELSDKVKRYKELRSRMIPIAINSMSPVDLQDMLRFRWSVASASTSEAPFSGEAYQEIFAYTKGLPRDAIKLADEILRHMFINQIQTANKDHVIHSAKQLDMEK